MSEVEKRKEMMSAMKKALREKKYTQGYLARMCYKSTSTIANQLQGNYPVYKGYQLTKYLADAIESLRIDVPQELRTY